MSSRANDTSSTERRHTGAKIAADLEGMDDITALSQERPPIASGEVTEKFFPGEVRDAFYLAPEDLQEYGIPGAIPASLADTKMPGDKVYVCLRAPAAYGKQEPGYMRRKRLNRPTLEIVRDGEGNPVYATEDLIYGVIDRSVYLQRLAQHNRASERFTRGLIEGQVETNEAQDDGILQNFRADDPRFIRRKYQEARSALAGMKQKWPPGMSIEDIEKHMAERTRDIERAAARNGRGVRPGEYEQYEERRAAAAKKAKTNAKVSYPGQPTK